MNRIRKRITDIKLNKDNSGSAIVMVVIALAFIAILGVTIMWMSLSNFRMKATDQKNKQGFYTAETVFEQIKMGLQGDASEAANLAYSYVMQKYSDLDEVARENEFKRQFKRSLIKLVSEDGTGTSTTFKISHLQRYIDGNLNISINSSAKGDPIRYLGAKRSGVTGDVGDIEGASVVGGTETGYIVLKDIVLEYTDDDGFYSEINTDIMITAPTTSFIDSSSLPPVFKYAMIADEGIDVGAGSLTVNGGIYAGGSGMKVGTILNINDADYIISKGPLEAEKNSTVKVSSGVSSNNILFASDINVDQARLDINADTRVADDINIKGNGAGYSVKLSNKYCGFGDAPFDNNNSSAIVINGLNTDMDLSGLTKLVLAGRSFVATGSAKTQLKTGEADPGEPTDLSGNHVHVYDNNYNVKMGESIAVKGNQLAYLVPTECIAVGSKTVKGKNPMTWSELATFTREKLTDNTLEIVNYNTATVEWLDGHTLDYFMPASSDSYIQKVFAPSNGEVLCYFYVVLDEHKMINTPGGMVDAASQYAQWYYDSHESKMDRYMDVYAPSIKLPTSGITAAATLISSAGRGGAKEHLVANPLSNSDKDDCDFYRNAYKGYCWDLTGNAISGFDEATLSSNNLVFEHTIVSENSIATPSTNLKDFLDDPTVAGRGHVTELTVQSGPHAGKKALVVDEATAENVACINENGDVVNESKSVYVYDDTSDDVRIIISTKDILLKKSFKGVIITDGKIYTADGVTITGIGDDLDMKEEIMSVLGAKYDDSVVWDVSTPASWRPIDFFKNGASYIGTADAGSGTGSVDIDSSVNYRNWIKN